MHPWVHRIYLPFELNGDIWDCAVFALSGSNIWIPPPPPEESRHWWWWLEVLLEMRWVSESEKADGAGEAEGRMETAAGARGSDTAHLEEMVTADWLTERVWLCVSCWSADRVVTPPTVTAGIGYVLLVREQYEWEAYEPGVWGWSSCLKTGRFLVKRFRYQRRTFWYRSAFDSFAERQPSG